jgi:hypothetical protein
VLSLIPFFVAIAVFAALIVIANRFHARFQAAPVESAPKVEPPRAVEPSADIPTEAAEAARNLALLKWREGFMNEDDVIDYMRDAMADEFPDVDTEELINAALDDAIATVAEEQKQWPAATDCDRVDAAFAALEKRGVIALQNFSCCGNCGHGEALAEMKQEALERPLHGYAFYHAQDTERAAAGDGLYIAFGDDTTNAESQEAVAGEIVTALRDAGLAPEWDASVNQRVFVPLTWQRRRS